MNLSILPKRYLKFIESINNLHRKLDDFERHHILPRCLGGDDSPENMINLTYREHFIAHLMLFHLTKDKRHLYSMVMLFPRCEKYGIFNSSKKVEYYRSAIKRLVRNHVHVFDIQENRFTWIDINEYKQSKDRYKHHNSGKLTVYDLIEEKFVSISVILYELEKNVRYVWKSRPTRQRYINKITNEIKLFDPKNVNETEWEHFNKGKDAHNKGVKSNKVPVINIETQEQLTISVEEYNIYKNVKYKHITYKNKPVKMVPCYDIRTNSRVFITSDEYNQCDFYIHATQWKRYLTKIGK